jgi:hypothetical protein
MACNVFISYSTADLEVAKQLQENLERQEQPRFTVFLAESAVKVGDTLSTEISNAIRACDFFVLLWSGAADQSKWVPQEVGQAIHANKPIFPIVLKEGCVPPAFIAGLKYLPAYRGEKEIRRWIVEELNEHARKVEMRNAVALLLLLAALMFLLCKE